MAFESYIQLFIGIPLTRILSFNFRGVRGYEIHFVAKWFFEWWTNKAEERNLENVAIWSDARILIKRIVLFGNLLFLFNYQTMRNGKFSYFRGRVKVFWFGSWNTRGRTLNNFIFTNFGTTMVVCILYLLHLPVNVNTKYEFLLKYTFMNYV